MEKTITLIKQSFLRLGQRGLILLAFFTLASIAAQAQYTQPKHYYGCSWNNGNYDRYAAIEAVTVMDAAGTTLYSKAADGCNESPSGLNVGHYHEIATNSPQFTLTAGSEYTIEVCGSNPLNNSTAIRVGVWIDFNGDGDFADADEWITPNGGMSVPEGGCNTFTFTALAAAKS